jgi:hypothetical protein
LYFKTSEETLFVLYELQGNTVRTLENVKNPAWVHGLYKEHKLVGRGDNEIFIFVTEECSHGVRDGGESKTCSKVLLFAFSI